ncbi:MAG: hypothetical protein NT009_13945 [Proteobacteria bacterium]|nr:hypothetical protein [Pseudomonadota bacterium]
MEQLLQLLDRYSSSIISILCVIIGFVLGFSGDILKSKISLRKKNKTMLLFIKEDLKINLIELKEIQSMIPGEIEDIDENNFATPPIKILKNELYSLLMNGYPKTSAIFEKVRMIAYHIDQLNEPIKCREEFRRANQLEITNDKKRGAYKAFLKSYNKIIYEESKILLEKIEEVLYPKIYRHP